MVSGSESKMMNGCLFRVGVLTLYHIFPIKNFMSQRTEVGSRVTRDPSLSF